MIISRRLGDRLRIDVPPDVDNNVPALTHFMLESDLGVASSRIFGAGAYSFSQVGAAEWSISVGGRVLGKASVVSPAKGRPRPCSSCREKQEAAVAKATCNKAASTC